MIGLAFFLNSLDIDAKMQRKIQRGYSIVELIIAIIFLLGIGFGIGSLFVLFHFIAKFW